MFTKSSVKGSNLLLRITKGTRVSLKNEAHKGGGGRRRSDRTKKKEFT